MLFLDSSLLIAAAASFVAGGAGLYHRPVVDQADRRLHCCQAKTGSRIEPLSETDVGDVPNHERQDRRVRR